MLLSHLNGLAKLIICMFIFLLVPIFGIHNLCAQTTNWQWANRAGGNNGDYSNSIASDNNGFSYVIGEFYGTANFGDVTLTCSESYSDIFVAKMDPNGNWLWAKRAGGTNWWDRGYGIAIDNSGNCYITGKFDLTADFGSTLLSSQNSDVFVAKLDTYGNWLWAKKGGGDSNDSGISISTDSVGNCYITGTFRYRATFGNTTLGSVHTQNNEIFVAKLDLNGNWLWAKQAVGGSNDYGIDISTNSSGNSIITGNFGQTAYFGTTSVTSSGETDIFVASIDANGNWLWAKQAGGTSSDTGSGIAIDSIGNSYLIGSFNQTAYIGTTSLISAGESDVLVAKLDINGNWLWSIRIGSTSSDVGKDIAADSDGNIYVTGSFRQTVIFGNTTLISYGEDDIYVGKLDTNGFWFSAFRAGGINQDVGNSISSSLNGDCYVCGDFRSTAQFGTFILSSAGDIDLFVGKTAFAPRYPPNILNLLNPLSIYMNLVFDDLDLSAYFGDLSSSLSYSFFGNQNIACNILFDSMLELTPVQEWYGIEYITIRATNQWGLYVEQTIKVTVIQTWEIKESFDHAGVTPENWTTQHSGTTDFPWQPVLIEADDYAMKTMANTGRTANERLFSPTYNLSDYKDIVVSFDTDFLPYGSGSGTFAYTLNNVTYTVVETFNTAASGVKTYTIPNLDAKPSVKFRWLYANSSANTGQDNYWIVDNFSIFGVVRDTQAPSTVSGLVLDSQTSNSASLSWQASSDIYFGRYELYISTDDQVSTTDQLLSVGQDPALYNVGTTTTTISGLATGDFWIAIRAVDLSNNASSMSDPVFVHIDGEAPIFSNPIPDMQPEPAWTNTRTVNIGCSISDYSTINPESLLYRIDANGNGLYDESESWTIVPPSAISSDRDALNILLEVVYEADGLLAFEFKATDQYGNSAYSGQSSLEGITDDWVLRIDTLAPVFSSAIPINQPEPEWMQTQAVQIGCTIEDMNQIQTIEYRFDSNGNGSYDPEEAWQSFTPSRSMNRNLLVVEVPMEFGVDGVRSFEFKATDMLDNVSYSGFNSQEGIGDDWVVRMDTTAPIFIDPIPSNQPSPVWATLLEVHLGATIYDHNEIDQSSVMYRIDMNRNGTYDPEEEWIPLILRSVAGRNSLPISAMIVFPSDGVYAFEFKAADLLGNVGYSGLSATNGIEDDWYVMIDTNPPFFSLPIPGDQPQPLWSNNYSVTIGTTILDSLAIDMSSVQYRYDQNQNGFYDPEENWQDIPLQRSRTSRSVQVPIEVDLLLSSDGVYKFEFRASDPNEVTGYSGISQLQGIDDDWIFRIDTIAPAVITNFFAQEITDTSVQLTWAVSADTNFLGYRIHYSTLPEVSTTDPCWDWNNDPNMGIAGSGLVSTIVSGLNPATRYYFILIATDEVGWVTQFPQVITAMTTSSAEPMAPANLNISIENGLVILNWDDVTQDVLGNPIIPSYYEVFVGDHPEFICNFDSLIATVNESYLELADVVDYADRLFFKVIAHIGMIRNTK